MQIDDFFIVPESKIDEQFITEEMTFLIDASVRNKLKTKEEYKELIENRYFLWLSKNISYS